MSKRISRSAGAGGFTLVDILIVTMILGIIGMMVAPQFHSLIQESRLNAATGELVSGLEYAADLAVVHQRPFGVRTSSGSSSFSVYDSRFKADSGSHPTETPPVTALGVVLNPVDKTWYVRDLSDNQAVISSVTPAGGVVFYPDGHCSAPSNTLVVTVGAEFRTVSVNGINGRIQVE